MSHFALARLIGLRSDAYAVSLWIMITVVCYFTLVMPVALAVPAAVIAIQISICLTGAVIIPVWRRALRPPAAEGGRRYTGTEDNRRANAIVFMAVMVIASVIVAAGTRWQRYVADVFLAIVIANVVAAGIERCDD